MTSGDQDEGDDLAGITGKRVGGEPTDEAEQFYVCAVCGQAVDMRDLGDVLYHEEHPTHPPRRTN